MIPMTSMKPVSSMSATTLASSAARGVSIRGLRVGLAGDGTPVLDGIDLDVAPGRLIGVVGESGSGKTTLGLALLGYTRPGLRLQADELKVGGADLMSASSRALRAHRGRIVSYVPQDAATALNPGRRIGYQLDEMLRVNGWNGATTPRVQQLLEEVNLPTDESFRRRFPFELSGGQQQRVGIAMAFACRPSVVVMDEPTTGLDVLTQTRVLETVRGMVNIHGCTGLYISHDLSVVANLVDDLAVMYAGSIVESGPAEQVFRAPRHPYTRRLIDSVPSFTTEHELRGIPGAAPSVRYRLPGCQFGPRCLRATEACTSTPPEVTDLGARTWRCIHPLTVDDATERTSWAAPIGPRPDGGDVLVEVTGLTADYSGNTVLHDVDLRVPAGQCVGVLGESGSGKTTLSRLLAGVELAGAGSMTYAGEPLPRGTSRRTSEQRRRIGYVFQNPYSSLNPRRRIGESLAVPLRLLGTKDPTTVSSRVARALELVSLPPDTAEKYPRQLSGGERQRAAIARALVTDPEFLICDEVTSALDVSVQASIVSLLRRLRRDVGLTILFVTHDIALLRFIADEIVVLRHGRIVEHGPTRSLLEAPVHDYSRALVDNARQLNVDLGETPTARPGGPDPTTHPSPDGPDRKA
jgi:peptide/nickel transport system ATP-binding protein